MSVVFKVLTVVYNNLNINLLLLFVNFDLLLVNQFETVDTSEPPTFAVNVASVCEIIFCTNACNVEPALFVNDIDSPYF